MPVALATAPMGISAMFASPDRVDVLSSVIAFVFDGSVTKPTFVELSFHKESTKTIEISLSAKYYLFLKLISTQKLYALINYLLMPAGVVGVCSDNFYFFPLGIGSPCSSLVLASS